MAPEIRSSPSGAGITPAADGLAATGARAGSAPPAADARRHASEPDLPLTEALDAGGIGAWSWSPGSDTIAATETARRLWGFSGEGEVAVADVLGAILPEDRERARTAVLTALVPGEASELAVRVLRSDGETAWVQVRGREAAPSGRGRLVGVTFDVTERMHAEEELRRARREARARFREIKALYHGAPVGLALLDRDLRQVRVNRRLAELFGDLPTDPVDPSSLDIAPDMRAKLEPILREVIDTGERRGNVEMERPSPSGDGKSVFNCHFYPLQTEAGSVVGIGLVVEDVTAYKGAVQARDLLSRELSHRIKNLFAVVSSLVTLSARGDKSFQTFARALRGRIEALGRAHDYVRPSEWDRDPGRNRTLANLLTTVLAPYRSDTETGGPPRIAIEGCDVPIGSFAATALALTLYELATNAVKYGALSRPEGRVEVSCRVIGDALELTWSERGGPPVEGRPEKEGFGSMLARRTFEADLNGAIVSDWQRDGLVLKLTAPLPRLAR